MNRDEYLEELMEWKRGIERRVSDLEKKYKELENKKRDKQYRLKDHSPYDLSKIVVK